MFFKSGKNPGKGFSLKLHDSAMLNPTWQTHLGPEPNWMHHEHHHSQSPADQSRHCKAKGHIFRCLWNFQVKPPQGFQWQKRESVAVRSLTKEYLCWIGNSQNFDVLLSAKLQSRPNRIAFWHFGWKSKDTLPINPMWPRHEKITILSIFASILRQHWGL